VSNWEERKKMLFLCHSIDTKLRNTTINKKVEIGKFIAFVKVNYMTSIEGYWWDN
jgi:hypothetical protein